MAVVVYQRCELRGSQDKVQQLFSDRFPHGHSVKKY